MDFVIHRHAEIAAAFAIASVGVWWLARRRRAPEGVQRPLTVLCVLLALQGAVGLDQYETHLPTELVWVHVALACCAWIAVAWAVLAAGPLAVGRRADAGERGVEGAVRPVASFKLPGN
jgi:cytochrome c oxidase assembly protein subunit 15